MTWTFPLEHVAACESTSTLLRVRAEAGAHETALLADLQRGGRGRMGRTWQSVEGNLFLSALLRPAGAFVPGHWSLLAAVVLAESLAAAAPGVRLKWPNDVMLAGGKLGGVLIEAGGPPQWLVIGFGANLRAAPDVTGRAVAALGGSGPPPLPFARALLARLESWRGRYRSEGFAPVRAAWQGFGPAPDEPVRVSGQDEGRFAGIDEDGAMLVRRGDATRRVVTGEVL